MLWQLETSESTVSRVNGIVNTCSSLRSELQHLFFPSFSWLVLAQPRLDVCIYFYSYEERFMQPTRLVFALSNVSQGHRLIPNGGSICRCYRRSWILERSNGFLLRRPTADRFATRVHCSERRFIGQQKSAVRHGLTCVNGRDQADGVGRRIQFGLLKNDAIRAEKTCTSEDLAFSSTRTCDRECLASARTRCNLTSTEIQ